jgi:RNA polymerase sigma-70 factor (ECF subfamily)
MNDRLGTTEAHPPQARPEPLSAQIDTSGTRSADNRCRSVRIGSAASFDAFYRGAADKVRRALCLALADVELGTEATDEAMARACSRWTEVATYANPEGWVYRVGLNWARSRQRRRRWRDLRPVPDHPAPEVPDDHDLSRALTRLTLEQRAVVVCRYLLDWTEDDTAAALDIPVGTVKSRLSRALHRLAQHLEVDQ